MIISFRLEGEKARKFPSFLYRVPVREKLIMMNLLSTNDACVCNFKYNEYVNSEITIETDREIEYLTVAIMTLIPNEYTQSKIKKRVAFARFNNIYFMEHSVEDLMRELVRRAAQ